MKNSSLNLIKEDIPVKNLYSYKCDLLNHDEIVKSVGEINKKFAKVGSVSKLRRLHKRVPICNAR